MKKQELNVLNRAIDGKEVYRANGINNRISELLIDLYKDKLIRKGILKDKKHFTIDGVKIVQQIKDYKESKKYLTINNLTIGINGNKAVALMYNPVYDEYKFSRIQMPIDWNSIFEEYSFFADVDDKYNRKIGVISHKEFEEKYICKNRENINIIKRNNTIEEAYLIKKINRKVFLYDCQSGMLAIVGKEELTRLLKGALE